MEAFRDALHWPSALDPMQAAPGGGVSPISCCSVSSLESILGLEEGGWSDSSGMKHPFLPQHVLVVWSFSPV